jgi:single-strand DNA-binding protein
MLPRITVEGTAVADSELRFSQSGTAVGRLRLVAQDRRMNKETNEWEDGDQLWIDVTCFKQLAENVAESVLKGDRVIVTGKIRTEEWNDRETGDKRSKVALIADAVAVSLQFRPVPHTSKAARSSTRDEADPFATSPSSDEPPF